MKLTDEQNKELDFWLEENMLVGDELTLDQIKLIRSMRSSERAWKEEAEQLQEKLKGIGVEEYLTLKYKYGELQNENARLRRGGWISVEERLPEQTGLYLVAFPVGPPERCRNQRTRTLAAVF